MRVRISVSVPVLAGAVLHRGSERSLVMFKYDKVPIPCQYGGLLGHTNCELDDRRVHGNVLYYGKFMEADVPEVEITQNVTRSFVCDITVDRMSKTHLTLISLPRALRKRKLLGGCIEEIGPRYKPWNLGPFSRQYLRGLCRRSVIVDAHGRWAFFYPTNEIDDDLLRYVYSYTNEDAESSLIQ